MIGPCDVDRAFIRDVFWPIACQILIRMKGAPFMKVLILFFALFLMGLSIPFLIEETFPEALKTLQSALPDRTEGWAVHQEDRFFDNITIFEYINGGGELYRAYNLRECFSRRYVHPAGPTIVLDIFDMGSSEDAFGVFTHDRNGEAIDMGQGGLYASGWLRFWKDRFFISIYTERETVDSRNVLHKLGRAVASFIPGKGQKPGLVSRLPSKGLQSGSIRFFHHHFILNHHFYLANENILNLDSRTKAVLAEYGNDSEPTRLLMIHYPEAEVALEAHNSFLAFYLPESDRMRPVMLENGKWTATARRGSMISIVFDAKSRGFAEELVQEAVGP
jgi:hypothetical protein